MSSILYRNAVPIKQTGGSKGSALTLKEMDDNFWAIDVTEGTVAANKAIVVDANLDFTGVRNMTITGDLAGAKNITFVPEEPVIFNATTTNVDWSAAQKQILTMSTSITTLDFTTNPDGPCNLVLKIVNSGVYTITTWGSVATIYWPGGTAPIVTPSGTDIISLYFDGTNYYGVATQAFA